MNERLLPPGQRPRNLILVAMALLLAVIVAGYLWFGARGKTPPPAEATPIAALPGPTPELPASAPESPVPETPQPPPARPLAATEVEGALIDLMGRKAVQSFLQTADFPRNLAATVDNLGRSHAAPIVWPVKPTPGRFTVQQLQGQTTISSDNGARYTPFVLLAETINIGLAADLYARMYPLLQQAYIDLGYPNGHFNRRLIEVIDLLLATPVKDEPVKMELTQVRGSVPSLRPWLRYQFADAELQSLPAGQKLLLRMGPVNARRLKAKLGEFRREILRPSAER